MAIAVECPDGALWYREYVKRIMWAKYVFWAQPDNWQYWNVDDALSIGMWSNDVYCFGIQDSTLTVASVIGIPQFSPSHREH